MCVMCSTSVPTLFAYFFTITSLHSFTFFMKCFLLLVSIPLFKQAMPRVKNCTSSPDRRNSFMLLSLGYQDVVISRSTANVSVRFDSFVQF